MPTAMASVSTTNGLASLVNRVRAMKGPLTVEISNGPRIKYVNHDYNRIWKNSQFLPRSLHLCGRLPK